MSTQTNIQHPTSPPRLGEEILHVDGVSRGFNKTQGELLVLEDVNLTLQEGEIVGLLGRSGSGRVDLVADHIGTDRADGRPGHVYETALARGRRRASRWCSRPSRCSLG